MPASAPATEPGRAKSLADRHAADDEVREQLGLPAELRGAGRGDVNVESEAYTKGLREGDLITEAGQQKVATPEDLEARITEAEEAGRKSLLLLVRRDGDPRFVALSLDQG